MQQNQSKLQLTRPPPPASIPSPKDTKIIIINPITTTNCEDKSEASSIIFQSKQANSIESTSIRDSAQKYTYSQMHQSEEISYEQENESMRKLYKEMKKQEHKKAIQNQVEFLYRSQREEEVVREVEIEKEEEEGSDYQDQPQIIIAKNSSDILYRQIPKNRMVECIVKIAQNSFLSLEKHIELYLVQEKRLLLKAKKSKLSVSTAFSVEREDGHKIAVFESNLSRKQYKYRTSNDKQKQDPKDNKEKYTETTYDSSLIKLNPVKVELSSIQSPQKCYLVFRPNFLGTNQQRVKIIKPKTKVYKSTRFSDIKSSYQNFQYDRLQIFESKIADKNHKGELIIDFKTKSIMESRKNMMIEDENGAVCLSFYKRKDNIYMLTVIHPFNIVEAFFVAVSNLDHIFF